MNKRTQSLPSGKRIKVTLLVIYIIIIVYFMFFGFSRPQIRNTFQEYQFSIIPTGIPLWIPVGIIV